MMGRMPALDARTAAAIFGGGAAGALTRAGLVRAIPHDPASWPWVTFAVNLAGAFILGALVTRLQERLPLSSYERPLIGTGFCGALTTFSTMQLELVQLADAGRAGLAVAYGAASVLGGFGAVLFASQLVRRARLGP
jgi:fluoride exporter